MKKIFLLLCVLSFSATAMAQAPEGRTAGTIVADVLAQMPTEYGTRFDGLMEELASTGEEGVLKLAGMLVPPGTGSNARVEYALSGLTHWVSAKGREAQQGVVSAALAKAFASATDGETKAFIAEQLELMGGTPDDVSYAASGNVPNNPVILGPEAARTAALSQKMVSNPAKVAGLLKKALKDDDRRYRFAAMELASKYGPAYGTALAALTKARPEVKADILNWLGGECDIPGRRVLVAPLAGDAAIAALSSPDADVKAAAASLLTKIGGERAISALAGLLKSSDASTVALAAKALASTAGDIASAVAPLVPTLGDGGKVAALGLLAGRGAEKYSDAVFAGVASASPEVREAAYSALKDVVSIGDAGKLWPMLESASPEDVPSVQRAISSALHTLPSGEQYAAVSERMNAAPAAKQYLYYPVLAYTGDEGALELMVDRFGKENGAAKDAAFGALNGWQTVDVADRLLAICKNPAEAPYFDRAITRYTALVSASSLSGEERRAKLVEALNIAKTGPQQSAILRSLGETDSYPGMVEAGEYLDNADNAVRQAAAGAVMKIALGNPQFRGDEVRGLLEKVITVLDNPDAGYEQQAIRKHLAEMPALEPFVLSDGEKAEGFTVLFDGTNLDAWTGNKTDYRVENGTISLYPSRSFGGNLYTAKEYGNFVFRFEFQLTPGANNGVGIRTPKDVDAAYHGMEIQILDHDDPAYSGITTHQVHGSVYGVIGAKRAVLKPAGEWNVEEIYADGDHIKVTLNGEVILDGNIRTASKGGTFDGQQHPGLFNKKGYIGFLGHGSQLKFRNIRIRELR